jgi:hypothetical protein
MWHNAEQGVALTASYCIVMTINPFNEAQFQLFLDGDTTLPATGESDFTST